jgi:hypothetical protein
MNSRSKSLVLLILALILPPTTYAQEKVEQREELEKNTLALLNDISSAAYGLKLPENRLFIISNTADLLWTFDEKRARALYWEALNTLNSINPPARTTGEVPSKTDREKMLQAYFSTFALRQRLLRQIARRDAQLALDMLRATRQVPPRQLGPEFRFPDDRQLEQEIATAVAARDPAQALQLARQSLAKGLTLELLNLTQQLNEKDSEKASQFAGDIIDKLETTDVATDYGASIIALNLLESSRIPGSNSTAELRSPGMFKPLKLNDEQRRDLVELLTNAVLSASANSSLLHQISYVMPEIQQFFPERRAALERKLATFNETLTKQQREQITYNTLVSSGTPEEIVRSANTAGDASRLALYEQAAIIAVSRRRTDSFRELVNKEISDSGERRKILDFVDAEEISVATGRKQLDELRKLLPTIRSKEERARAMAELALMLKEKGEDTEAATLLDEAATLVKMDFNDDKRTNALLALLCAYAIVDPTKAFALAERTVDHANTQISFLMLLDRVVKSGVVKKSEIVLEQPGILPLDLLVFKYGKGVAALAKADFSRTRALADRFERNELRLMAQLMIVKGILQPETPITPAPAVVQN